MKGILTGMFIEKNKHYLLPKDLGSAVKALEDDSEDKASELFDVKLKSPSLNTFFATFLGWLGVDCFYLGKIKNGIVRIIMSVINVGLFILTAYLINTILEPICFDLMQKEIVIKASVIHLACILVSFVYTIAHLVILAINRAKANVNAKIANKHILGIRNLPEHQVINHWKIG